MENKIERSFSLYCFMYNKQNLNQCCKSRINFNLSINDLKFDNNGVLTGIKYVRGSYEQRHSHPLEKEQFIKEYNLVQFIRDDLKLFGSNSQVTQVINFAKNKYNLELNFNQVYYLLNELDPLYKKSDGSDFVSYLMEREYETYYELDDNNQLTFLIYCSQFQKEIAKKYGSIMFFDTILGTNKYNRPRGTFVIQLNNGRILPILHCILSDQERKTFEKVFKFGLKKILNTPKLLITDQDPSILSAFKATLENDCYHIYCSRHATENAQKHIASLLNLECYQDLSASERIKLHSKILGLFNENSIQKAADDIEFIKNKLPEGNVKKYFLGIEKDKPHIFPAYINTFCAGHYTSNPV